MKYQLIDEKLLQISVPQCLYTCEVIFKCLYWYGDKYLCDVASAEEHYIITISLKNECFSETSVQSFMEKFKTDLIDYKTREIVSLETRNIRNLLVAKAFSNSDEFDELPPDTIADPVGFQPEEFTVKSK